MEVNQYHPPQGVYFLRQNKDIVYVGETNDIYRRISEHSRGLVKKGQERKIFDNWSYITCDDPGQRHELESMLIQLLRPKYNVDYDHLSEVGIFNHDHEIFNILSYPFFIDYLEQKVRNT